MNILFILPEYYPHSGGGISTCYINYIKALKPFCKKIKVIVGSGYTQSDEVFNIDDIEICYLKPALYQSYLNKFSRYDLVPEFKNNLAAAWAMYQQADYGKGFDVVECTDFGFGYIPWAINNQIPVITRLHGSSGQIYVHENNLTDALLAGTLKQVELITLPLCTKLVTYCNANKQFWENTINTSVIAISPVYHTNSQAIPYPERDNYGLVTARIQSWKGPVELCKAFALLNKKPLVKWFGTDKAYNQEQGTSAYLKHNYPAIWEKYIVPHSPMPNSQISKVQQQAKFGLVTSTWDMFNFTAVEFMSAGTPLICSDGAGSSELVIHGENGFKYPANDFQALADCIQKIDNISEKDYQRIAGNAVKTIQTELSAQKIIPQNLQLYKTAIQEFKPQNRADFVKSIYTPADELYTIDATLDKQPLRVLLSYLLNRLKSKYFGKK